MTAMSVYRVLLLVRRCWVALDWVFGWGSSARQHSLTLLHPYVTFLAQAIDLAVVLTILTGLWFFRRWARSLFVILLAVADVNSVFRRYELASVPPPFVVTIVWLVVMVNGVIIAMSFLPPERDMFAVQI